MDMDFWAARVQSSKHHLSAVSAGGLNNSDARLTIDDAGEDEIRAWFPCPFCYVEIEVPVLCSHLQEEHCFDLKNAVCPICAATLGKDPIGHFTMQHAHSVKRKRKTQRSGMWTNVSSTVSKDFRELTSLIGSNTLNYKSDKQEPASDPLLSPFLCSSPFSNSKDSKQDVSSGYSDSTINTERWKDETCLQLHTPKKRSHRLV
ncbi:OLC1v1013253C2 [Oldenlandia corymbosa var. corymbosa]|uniref:OLC1v1013253C2 n=1 Tax=Oldenlandia corymbosa var. corymbosa TaxID=529605 RepID=A0AAV1E0C3_OLDCO|nr:OLC1v1013253C2 [Oldenlandia corymbosa var. corymbosa]